MNRLLHYNVANSQHTNASYAQIAGWDIVGKTGTTNDDKDSWFCGMSPYAVMATWTGFDSPRTLSDTTRSAKFFAKVMGEYLKGREKKDYTLSRNVKAATYNPKTGEIISTENVSGKYIGYYTEDNMPGFGDPYYGDFNYDDNQSNVSAPEYDAQTSDYNGYQSSDSGGGGGESSQGGGDAQASDTPRQPEQPEQQDSGAQASDTPQQSEQQPQQPEQPQNSGGGADNAQP
jgi:penicillin-binding protein 1A